MSVFVPYLVAAPPCRCPPVPQVAGASSLGGQYETKLSALRRSGGIRGHDWRAFRSCYGCSLCRRMGRHPILHRGAAMKVLQGVPRGRGKCDTKNDRSHMGDVVANSARRWIQPPSEADFVCWRRRGEWLRQSGKNEWYSNYTWDKLPQHVRDALVDAARVPERLVA